MAFSLCDCPSSWEDGAALETLGRMVVEVLPAPPACPMMDEPPPTFRRLGLPMVGRRLWQNDWGTKLSVCPGLDWSVAGALKRRLGWALMKGRPRPRPRRGSGRRPPHRRPPRNRPPTHQSLRPEPPSALLPDRRDYSFTEQIRKALLLDLLRCWLRSFRSFTRCQPKPPPSL